MAAFCRPKIKPSMAGTIINGSPNITTLDANFTIDMCNGIFKVDVIRSAFVVPGNILGAKVKITHNTYNTVIRDYPSSTYDIDDVSADFFQMNLPTQGLIYQVGKYTIDVELTDADNQKYYVSKTGEICEFNDSGFECAKAVADCKNGHLHIVVNKPPNYRGKQSSNQTQTWKVVFPDHEQDPIQSSYPNFSVDLYEGIYTITGSVCAEYDFGDGVKVKVPYSANFKKPVTCSIDYSCIRPRIKYYYDLADSGCSLTEKMGYLTVISRAYDLVQTIEMEADAGGDPSPYIDELEILLDCKCGCGCGFSNSQVLNSIPAANVQITGCGFDEELVGLTKIYNFAKQFTGLTFNSQNVISAGGNVESTCGFAIPINYSSTNAYAAIKLLINTSTEYNFFGNVIKQHLTGISPALLACIGLDTTTFNALTLKGVFERIMLALCTGSGGTGSSCPGTVYSDQELISRSGSNVIVPFTATNCAYVIAIINGVQIAMVAASQASVTFIGAANGATHTIRLIPVCINGSWGEYYDLTFTMTGCPDIEAPGVSQNTVTGAVCPADISGLVLGLPLGITAEWHNANSPVQATIINPTQVISGQYWVFAKNVNGCYSAGTPVTVTCASGGGIVTAPQNLAIIKALGGYQFSFESPTNPPSPVSYIVQRRHYLDPDIAGSYTTVAATGAGNDIAYNSITGRYYCLDSDVIQNTLYVYRAISNGGTNPYTDLTYADIPCTELSINNSGTVVSTSFFENGGEVDKYEVIIYDANGINTIASATTLPPYSAPEVVPLDVNDPGTYKVRLRPYIGTYFKDCPLVTTVVPFNYLTGTILYNNISPTSGSGTIEVQSVGGAFITMNNTSIIGTGSSFQMIISGGIGTINCNVSGLDEDGIKTVVSPNLPIGSYTFTATFSSGDTANGSIAVSA